MDPEKAGGSNVTIEAKKTSKLTPWRKYNSINPLRWRAVPPHAQERYVSKEATAGYLSKATFWWMGDLMNVSRGCSRPMCFVFY